MRSEFLKFTHDSLRKCQVAFLIWDTYSNGSKADAKMVELCSALVEVHLYFMIDGKDEKVNLYKNGSHTFEKIHSLGYQYVVCFHPDTLIKCEGAIEELLAGAKQKPEQFCYAYQEGHKLHGMFLLNLDKCEPTKIEEHLKTNQVSTLAEKFSCHYIEGSQRKLFSYKADVAAFGLHNLIAREGAALKEHLEEGFNVCFIFNTESYDDVEKLDTSVCVQHAVGFASGFKLNRLAWKARRNCREVTFIDINENALAFKEKLFLEWDGVDLPGWFQSNFAVKSFFYEKSESHFQESWGRELSLWGGQEKFAEHWQWFKNLSVTFKKINVLAEPGKLKSILQRTEDTLFWYSNLWNNEYVANIYGIKQLAQRQLQWLEEVLPKEVPMILLQDPIRVGSKKIHLSGLGSTKAIKNLKENLSHFPI